MEVPTLASNLHLTEEEMRRHHDDGKSNLRHLNREFRGYFSELERSWIAIDPARAKPHYAKVFGFDLLRQARGDAAELEPFCEGAVAQLLSEDNKERLAGKILEEDPLGVFRSRWVELMVGLRKPETGEGLHFLAGRDLGLQDPEKMAADVFRKRAAGLSARTVSKLELEEEEVLELAVSGKTNQAGAPNIGTRPEPEPDGGGTTEDRARGGRGRQGKSRGVRREQTKGGTKGGKRGGAK